MNDPRTVINSREFMVAVAACGDHYTRTSVAVEKALIDWHHRGQSKKIKRRKNQAQTLREALAVMDEYRSIIEHNLSGRVIHDPTTGNSLTLAPWCVPDSPVNAGPVLDAVASVIRLLADDLVERNPQGMADRKDRNFYYCLGRAFTEAGLEQPSVAALRGLGSVINTDDGSDDANILHAFASGANCMLSPK